MSADDPMIKPLLTDDYVAVGLACCFAHHPDTGKLTESWIYEPLTAGSLETIEKGIETSYKRVMALQAGDFFEGDPASPTGVKLENIAALSADLPEINAEPCSNIIERTAAASRTFRRRVEAKMLEFNEMSDEYNFSVERKRVLNAVKVVKDDDNVKQDMSIDVYGREKDEDEAATAQEIERLASV